jgi:perosamine synthetase
MGRITNFADSHGLWTVEDAAEAHGAAIAGRRVGSLATCGTFSFFGNKIITTGEGGMVTTDDDELAARLRLLRGQGMDPDRRYWFPVIGYNYRMTNIQAAIGLAQMEHIDSAIESRAEIASWYDELLAPLADRVSIMSDPADVKSVAWLYNVFLREAGAGRRDAVMARLDDLGIETRPVFYPMHVLPPYLEENTYPHADSWARSGITLPTHQGLDRSDVERIVRSLELALLDE